MPVRLSQVDDLTRPDHTFLTAEDELYYVGEYTARAGYSFSDTNSLIQNLKKPMDRVTRPEWRYKRKAIEDAAHWLREAIPEPWFREFTFAPMPPSKAKSHKDYDDRLVQILHALRQTSGVDVREIVTMTQSIEAAHLTDDPRRIQQLLRRLTLDDSALNPPPSRICIFDDVLTTGAHFKAVQQLIHAALPDVPVIGIFLARRAL